MPSKSKCSELSTSQAHSMLSELLRSLGGFDKLDSGAKAVDWSHVPNFSTVVLVDGFVDALCDPHTRTMRRWIRRVGFEEAVYFHCRHSPMDWKNIAMVVDALGEYVSISTMEAEMYTMLVWRRLFGVQI